MDPCETCSMYENDCDGNQKEYCLSHDRTYYEAKDGCDNIFDVATQKMKSVLDKKD